MCRLYFTAVEIYLTLSLCFSVLQVTVLTVTLVYYIYYIYHSTIIMHVVELLQTHRGHVDVSFLATWEQVREGNEWNTNI